MSRSLLSPVKSEPICNHATDCKKRATSSGFFRKQIAVVTLLIFAAGFPSHPARAANLIVGDNPDKDERLSITTNSAFDDVIVGRFGWGDLMIFSEGRVASQRLSLGTEKGHGGSVTVTGGMLENFGDTIVGDFATGTFEITIGWTPQISAGGQFVNHGSIILGHEVGSQGTMRVAAGKVRNLGEMVIGDFGTGTLDMPPDFPLGLEIYSASVHNSGDLIVGRQQGSQGTVTVRGTLQSDSFVYVGDSGTGTLTVTQQGNFLTPVVSVLGSNEGSQGTITVRGNWESGDLIVGMDGSGTLNIEQGGSVFIKKGIAETYLGLWSGASGSATVSGTWANNTLYVGGHGTGALTIENDGVVSASSVFLSYGYSGVGTLNLNDEGTLVTGELVKGDGTASVKFDGGTLRATRDNDSYLSDFDPGDITVDSGGVIFDTNGYNIGVSASFSGTGRLTKSGSGTLTFSGSNHHTGEVSVDKGSVKVNGTLDSTMITVNEGGTLGGSGKLNEITLNQGGLISPGNSAGTLHTGSQTWNEGSSYLWEVDSLTDSTHWDLLEIDGTLTLNPDEDGISILISALNLENASGLPLGLEENTTYRFTIATTTSGIIGFNATSFIINTDSFASSLGALGHFTISLSQDGMSLDLIYATIPESGTWSLAIEGSLLALVFSRRKRIYRIAS